MTEAEYLDDTPEQAAKIAKTSAPQPNPTTSDMLLLQQEAQEADDSKVLNKKREARSKWTLKRSLRSTLALHLLTYLQTRLN